MYVANLARPTHPVETIVGPVRVHVLGDPELVRHRGLATFSAGDPAELQSAREVNTTAAKLYRNEAVPQNVLLAHEPQGWFIGFFSICMYGREELTDGPYINAVGRDWCYEGAHLSDCTARPGDVLTSRGLETIRRFAGSREVPEVHALVRPENTPSLDMLINRYGFSMEGMFGAQHVLIRRAGPSPRPLSPAACEPLPPLVGPARTPWSRASSSIPVLPVVEDATDARSAAWRPLRGSAL
jgi:hypothetical protein